MIGLKEIRDARDTLFAKLWANEGGVLEVLREEGIDDEALLNQTTAAVVAWTHMNDQEANDPEALARLSELFFVAFLMGFICHQQNKT